MSYSPFRLASLLMYAAFLLIPGILHTVCAQEKAMPVIPSSSGPSGASISPMAGQNESASLSLTGSGLHPEPPLLGEKAEFPSFTREMIQVRWRAHDPIELYVIRPKGVRKPRPVLYLYSYPSETNRFLDNDYCERITKGGYAAVGFVSALTGQRYHDLPMKEWFVSDLQQSLVHSAHDVQMILSYLSDRGDFDLSEVGMFGQGSGGTIAILAASADPRIRALDLLDPWGDWPDWLAKSSLVPEEERPSYLKPEFLAGVAPLDPVRVLPELTTQAIRLQFVADTMITPPIAKERIASAAPSKANVIRYQSTRELYNATGGGRLFDWIKQELKEPVAQLPPSRQESTGASAAERHER